MAKPPCITEMYPGIDLKELEKALGTLPIQALADLRFIATLSQGHREFARLKQYVELKADEDIRKLKVHSKTILDAAKLVALGGATMPQ